MRPGALAVLAAVVVACEPAPIATAPSPSPSAGSGPTAGTGATLRSPEAPSTAQPTARPGVRATAAGRLPARSRYVAIDLAIADGVRTRLWLVDLDATRPPVAVAEWDAPASPLGGWSASADGTEILVSATSALSRVALFLVRPETGETRVLFEERGTVVVSARLSPDGRRAAFTKYPADGGTDLGLWSLTIGGGAPRRLAEPSRGSVPLMALAWSPGSDRLAFTREEDRTRIRVVSRDGGPEIAVGPGDRVSWRRGAPELLVASAEDSAGRIYSFDLGTGKTTDLVKVDRLLITQVEWHPALARFLYAVSEGPGREASAGIWVRDADGADASRVDADVRAFAPEWSSDGSTITALGGVDAATLLVIELPTGRRIAVLCRRGGRPPGDCL